VIFRQRYEVLSGKQNSTLLLSSILRILLPNFLIPSLPKKHKKVFLDLELFAFSNLTNHFTVCSILIRNLIASVEPRWFLVSSSTRVCMSPTIYFRFR